jgi:hypothetical protein
MRGWSTRYGSGWLAARSERGLSVEGGLAARLGLDLTLTQVPMSLLYEAGSFYETQLVARVQPHEDTVGECKNQAHGTQRFPGY